MFERLRAERRALSYQSIFRTGLDTFPPRPESGFYVDADSALRMSAVWAAQRMISNDIATLPVEAFSKAAGDRKPIRPKPAWIEEPDLADPSFTRIAHFQAVVLSILQDGNSYTLVEPDIYNPVRLEVLQPGLVRPHKDPGQDSPRYSISDQRGRHIDELTPLNIIHIAPFRKPGALKGLNPIQAASEGIGISLAAERFTARYFLNGASMPGFIKVPGDASETQLAEVDRKLRQSKGGWRNAGVLGYLTGGMDYVATGINPKDSDLSAIRAFQLEEVARIYGIPSHMLGIADTSRGASTASVEQRGLDYVTHCLRHYIEPIEAAYRRLIPGGQETYLKFNVNGLLRADLATRKDWYNVAIRDGIMSVNEVRRLEDMPAIDGGDAHLVQAQMVDVAGQKADVAAQPAALADPAAPRALDPEDRSRFEITVKPPEVNVAAPHVTVLPTPVTVEPTAVTVLPTPVTVVTPEPRRTVRNVVRNDDGLIVRFEETVDGE